MRCQNLTLSTYLVLSQLKSVSLNPNHRDARRSTNVGTRKVSTKDRLRAKLKEKNKK